MIVAHRMRRDEIVSLGAGPRRGGGGFPQRCSAVPAASGVLRPLLLSAEVKTPETRTDRGCVLIAMTQEKEARLKKCSHYAVHRKLMQNNGDCEL